MIKTMTKKPILNRDILREVFEECIQTDGFNKIDEFMLSGKKPFRLVLDYCNNANSVVVFGNAIVAKFPNIKYNMKTDKRKKKDDVIGTRISTSMKLFKPISIAIASTLTALEIKWFTPELIPMLKSYDQEMTDINIEYCKKGFKDILEACVNISGRLTLIDVDFETNFENMNCMYPQLRNIRNLTIFGTFSKYGTFLENLKTFAAFLSTTFPNLETLNIKFVYKAFGGPSWDWNDSSMADVFQQLPKQIQGCICFKLYTNGRYTPENGDLKGFQMTHCSNPMGFREYSKSFPITSTLSFKLMHQGRGHGRFVCIFDIYK